jgi:uncharacterized protein (DUF58 family)
MTPTPGAAVSGSRRARLGCTCAGFAVGLLIGAGAPVWLQLPFLCLALFLVLLAPRQLSRKARRLEVQRQLDERLGEGRGG